MPEEDIWAHWDDTFRFIRQARMAGSAVLVHCKMGVSRSASTVIAYAMKQYSWSMEKAHAFTKVRDSCYCGGDLLYQYSTLCPDD